MLYGEFSVLGSVPAGQESTEPEIDGLQAGGGAEERLGALVKVRTPTQLD